MPKVLDNIIIGARPDPASHTVTLTWANGETTVSDFRRLVGKGVFTAFSDPEFFSQLRVGEGGRSLEWPGELIFAPTPCGSRHTRKRRPSIRIGGSVRKLDDTLPTQHLDRCP
jgi:hypothetical protein